MGNCLNTARRNIIEETPSAFEATTSVVSFPENTLSLFPVDNLKRLCRRKRIPYRWNEYRLKGEVETLKEFVDLFWMEYARNRKDRLIWTSENSFVRVGDRFFPHHEVPGVYRNYRLQLKSSTHNLDLFSMEHYTTNLWLSIHSTTIEDAMSCLELLVGLHDDYFEEMEIFQEDGPQLCPLTCRLLEKVLLQSAKRKNSFDITTFTPDQCRTLATSGVRTDIQLIRCKFQDDGEAFLEALAARADPQTGLAKLTIRDSLPFAEGILVLLLRHLNLECLTLQSFRLSSEEGCRAVATAELQLLDLDTNFRFGDGGAALIESVREERGPKGLCLTEDLFYSTDFIINSTQSPERLISFMNALRGNTYLERLDLMGGWGNNHRQPTPHLPLHAALLENKGLTRLCLCGFYFDYLCWPELMAAISTHPSLRTLIFENIRDDPFSASGSRERTDDVADMMLVNKQLEEIRFDNLAFMSPRFRPGPPFDQTLLDSLVFPRLECNLYRKRFAALQKIEVSSTRAAIMATALVRVTRKPSLLWMALSQNRDIICSHLEDASTRDN
jgi:hypothetical protein